MISKVISVSTLIAVAGFASADVIVSYSFTDLDGSFDAMSSTFTASATDMISGGSLDTGGDVSRLLDIPRTAGFESGFLAFGTFADVQISLNVTNITQTSADASGTVTITDLGGDTLTADVSGSWTILNPFGFMFFSGVSENYTFADNNDTDGEFNGTNGFFDISDLVGNQYDGAVSLLLQNPGGFGADFSGVSTEGDGVLVPTPGSVLIGSLGALGMIIPRRRR